MNLGENGIMLGLGGGFGRMSTQRCNRRAAQFCPGSRQLSQRVAFAALFLVMLIAVERPGAAYAIPNTELTVEELKAKLASANIPDRPHLCVQIAERQMAETSKLYAAAEDEKAQATLTDVVAFSELARDYAIQSHKYQKQSEIAVREMTRKLTEIMHSLGHDDQAPIQAAITRMQRVRDDLLVAMFPKGQK